MEVGVAANDGCDAVAVPCFVLFIRGFAPGISESADARSMVEGRMRAPKDGVVTFHATVLRLGVICG